MSITKADLVNLLNQKLGLPKKDCIQIVENFFSEISDALAKGEEVKLPGLGNFSTSYKKSRPGRNPKTGVEVPITERNVVTFNSSNVLKSSFK